MDIQKHKDNLKKYIEEDFSFREPIKNMSDFDKYCYNHCLDIEVVLSELDKKEKVIDAMAEYIAGLMGKQTVKDYFIDKKEQIIDEI